MMKIGDVRGEVSNLCYHQEINLSTLIKFFINFQEKRNSFQYYRRDYPI